MKKRYILILLTTLYSNCNYAENLNKHQNSRKSCWTNWDNFAKESSVLMDKFLNNLEETKKNIDSMFNNFTDNLTQKTNIKNMNIFENNKENLWGIELKIPGFKKDEIKIKIDKEGYLHINAQSKIEKRKEKNDKNKKYIYKSEHFGTKQYSRIIKLPENIDYKNIAKAAVKYNEDTGILELSFPKKIERKQEKEEEIELKLK